MIERLSMYPNNNIYKEEMKSNYRIRYPWHNSLNMPIANLTHVSKMDAETALVCWFII